MDLYVGLMTIWFNLSAVLLGAMWVIPVSPDRHSREQGRFWLIGYLHKESKERGSFRVGVCMFCIGWGFQMTGASWSPEVRDIGALLLGVPVLTTTFNAGHTGRLSSGKAILLCCVLALGWMGWWRVLLNILYRC